MSHRKPRPDVLLLCAAALLVASLPAAADAEPPETPAEILVTVAPEAAAPGATVDVEVRLEPKAGIKINKYPRISIDVPALDGVVTASNASVGNDGPPSAEDMEAGRNYFKVVDPVRLKLAVEGTAPAGSHVVPAKLKYFYCVAASGFCAPKKTTIEIPITVR